jgi:tRNA(fMet)-specific endonuclease VapC
VNGWWTFGNQHHQKCGRTGFERPLTPRLRQISDLLADVVVVDFDSACAEQFGQFRVLLRRRGVVVAPLDLLIASVARVHDLTLVTHNTAHFLPIPGLRLVDWLAP